MKKTLFVLLLIFSFFSCYKTTADDARKVKKGISTNELKYIMGEPKDTEINPGYEKWTFYYDSGGSRLNGMEVIIIGDKVSDFYSY